VTFSGFQVLAKYLQSNYDYLLQG